MWGSVIPSDRDMTCLLKWWRSPLAPPWALRCPDQVRIKVLAAADVTATVEVTAAAGHGAVLVALPGRATLAIRAAVHADVTAATCDVISTRDMTTGIAVAHFDPPRVFMWHFTAGFV